MKAALVLALCLALGACMDGEPDVTPQRNPHSGTNWVMQGEGRDRPTIEFTDSRGRTGPVTINFPPGYGHADQQDRRYPVIYLLHGYGQTPEDLGAAILFLANWMNSPVESTATRLPKAIVVYVDGRCRTDDDGRAECIRGSFYNDSPREGGHQSESWWLELMDHVDTKYRTMGESEVDWTE